MVAQIKDPEKGQYIEVSSDKKISLTRKFKAFLLEGDVVTTDDVSYKYWRPITGYEWQRGPVWAGRDADSKPSNPKEAFGSLKVDTTVVPTPSIMWEALAMMDGGGKYGPHNYREMGVKISTYLAALDRHIKAFVEGEDVASDSNIYHLGHAKACIGIIIDGLVMGNIVDDRPPKLPEGWLDSINEMAAKIVKKHAHRNTQRCTQIPLLTDALTTGETADLALKVATGEARKLPAGEDESQ